MSAAMMDRFKVSSPACVPAGRTLVARGNAINEAHRFPTAPRGISHHRSRPVSGLVGSVRIAFPGARAPSGRGSSRTRSAGLGLLVDTPAPLTVAGAAEDLEGLGNPNPLPHLFPVSPRREKHAGTPRTSALIVQHKSQVSTLRRHRESTLKTNPYTLT